MHRASQLTLHSARALLCRETISSLMLTAVTMWLSIMYKIRLKCETCIIFRRVQTWHNFWAWCSTISHSRPQLMHIRLQILLYFKLILITCSTIYTMTMARTLMQTCRRWLRTSCHWSTYSWVVTMTILCIGKPPATGCRIILCSWRVPHSNPWISQYYIYIIQEYSISGKVVGYRKQVKQIAYYELLDAGHFSYN